MPAAYDILLNNNGDLPIDKGVLTLGASDNQHISDCLVSFPGWWKQYPQNGVGMGIYYKARVVPGVVLNRVNQQLRNDGYTLLNPSVTVNNGVMEVNPNAVRQ